MDNYNIDSFDIIPTNTVLDDLVTMARSLVWVPEEISYDKDNREEFEKLNNEEQNLIKKILGFFAFADAIVNNNISFNFSYEMKDKFSVVEFYNIQSMIEDVHKRVYNKLIKTYFTSEESSDVIGYVNTVDIMNKKAKWANKWMSQDIPLVKRIIAFAAVEGIFFASSFAVIYWLARRKVLPALIQSNEFISRDETLHKEFALAVVATLFDKDEYKDCAGEIIKEAVDIECEFFKYIIPPEFTSISSDKMSMYIKHLANNAMHSMGLDIILYPNVSNPFDFMFNISGQSKVNFFEYRNTFYKKPLEEDGNDNEW